MRVFGDSASSRVVRDLAAGAESDQRSISKVALIALLGCPGLEMREKPNLEGSKQLSCFSLFG